MVWGSAMQMREGGIEEDDSQAEQECHSLVETVEKGIWGECSSLIQI